MTNTKKQKSNWAEFKKKFDEQYVNFATWKDITITTIRVQRENLWRADSVVSTFNALIDNEMAKLVAHKQPMDKMPYWAWTLSIKTQRKLDQVLGQVLEVLESYDLPKLLKVSITHDDDGLLQLVPFLNTQDIIKVEDAYWGDITFQAVRPYGEKLNDIARQIYTELYQVVEKDYKITAEDTDHMVTGEEDVLEVYYLFQKEKAE